VRVVATTTDQLGGQTVFNGTGQVIQNVNDAPSGTVTITDPVTNPEPAGVTQGETLTASNTLTDADVIVGSLAYQWQRWVDANNNGLVDSGETTNLATGSSYTTTAGDVGAKVRVVASYTDGGNTTEQVASAPTTTVMATAVTPTTMDFNGGVAGSDVYIEDGMKLETIQSQSDSLNFANFNADADFEVKSENPTSTPLKFTLAAVNGGTFDFDSVFVVSGEGTFRGYDAKGNEIAQLTIDTIGETGVPVYNANTVKGGEGQRFFFNNDADWNSVSYVEWETAGSTAMVIDDLFWL
jgi:hypothetical protein